MDVVSKPAPQEGNRFSGGVPAAVCVHCPAYALVSPREFGGGSGARKWFALFAYIGYIGVVWAAIRCIRGLFLAGSKTALLYPKSYTIWPR